MRIIVYGSLRRKQGNSHWMTNATWLGDDVISGYALYDLGEYPAAVHGEGEIYCEVYRISAGILAELDALKSHPRDYKRELINTAYGSAWIYIYQHSVDSLKNISGGDWTRRLEE